MKLPITHHEVVLLPYVPQRVFERYQEMITKNLKIDMNLHITVDTVAEQLGAERAQAIQNAESDQARTILMNEARQDLIMRNAKAEINIADQHEAERERIIGMVERIGDDLPKRETIENLPRRDYAALQEAIKRIEAEEEAGKSQGQSEE